MTRIASILAGRLEKHGDQVLRKHRLMIVPLEELKAQVDGNRIVLVLEFGSKAELEDHAVEDRPALGAGVLADPLESGNRLADSASAPAEARREAGACSRDALAI